MRVVPPVLLPVPSPSATTYDLAIVGAGINGAGIARDAAGRGLKVLLVEQDDIAAATSQWSTKLIHGGLRYLEHYEFRLVRESLAEREVLLHCAPHLVAPLAFVLPHEPHLRPAWMIRLGLFLYDHLGRRKTLPGSFGVDLGAGNWGAGLKPRFRKRLRLRRRPRRRRAAGAAHGAWRRAISAPTCACAPASPPAARERRRPALARDAGRRGRRARARSPRGRWSTPRAVGQARARPGERRRPRARTSATSRAATSWCRACTARTTRTSCRTPTSGSCS